MANFALVCNYEFDYGMKLLQVDSENTIGEVIQVARDGIAGVFVAEPEPGVALKLRKYGTTEFLDENLKISETGFKQAETIEIIHVYPKA